MSLNIKTTASKSADIIILPFVKGQENINQIKNTAGITYEPKINLKAKETLTFIHPEKDQKIIVLCLGEEADKVKSFNFFRFTIHQLKSKNGLTIDVIADHLDNDYVFNAALGLKTSFQNHGIFKTENNKDEAPKIQLIVNKNHKKDAERGITTAETQLNIMHLVDMPSNIKNPAYIVDYAINSGKKHGYSVTVHGEKDLKKMKADALLAVGQGSPNETFLAVLEYKPKGSKSNKPKLGLVGKGISFDTGGISIKPHTNMGFMKCDMGGAAAVIGAVELAARLKLDIHVVGIVSTAENSVDGNSYRPGDVIGSYSGKSIEIINTDAEGRLALADGLAFIIKNHQPEFLIDLATLTGNVILALGYHYAGLFTKNDKMADDLIKAGVPANENLWRMPMGTDFTSRLHSDIADIKNLDNNPVAGSVFAAKFLETFTSEHPQWAHLDIAGVAFSDSDYTKMRSATAYGVRLLVNYMELIK